MTKSGYEKNGKKRYPVNGCLFAISLFFSLWFLSSCSGQKESVYHGLYVYCINTAETQVAGEKVTLKSTTTDKQIRELIGKMKQEPKEIGLKKSISEDMVLKEYTVSENGDLCLYWTTSYANYSGVSEVLRRAAIVKTLCQIDGVHTVEFYVAGQPLTDSNMNAIGYMTADTFVDNTGDQVYTQKMTLNIYFSNQAGNMLKKVPVTITYDASIPIEQLVVEQLIKGPDDVKGLSEKDVLRTIPAATKVNKISVKENICYIDLSADFMEKLPEVTNEVAVYSIVNTLTNLSNINRVQFSIDGEQNLLFNDAISFGNPFETNLNIVNES